jgi:large subunit ribosomal protein L9
MAYMEVLLREDVENLGNRGQVVRVRRGYGRNYLLPRGIAVEASAANVRQIEAEKKLLARREARERAVAVEAVKNFDGIELSFERKAGDEGKLFGSVSTIDIARALEAQGKTIERHNIRLKDAIKQVGEYLVPVRLHRDVVANLKVTVTAEGGPANVAAAAAPAAPVAAAPAAPEVDDSDEFDEFDEE